MAADSDAWRDWPAPAKLNLFLHITGRRADGYHLLQTLFQFLDHGDTLHFAPRRDGRVQLATPLSGVADDDHLAVRAARLLQAASGGTAGVTVELVKRLPMGGGLGGGSSDAATTLVALNRLWGCGLALHDLMSLAVRLGADVPVFVQGHAAWAEGVGEQLEPVVLDEPWYVVLVPPLHAATAELFADSQLIRDCPPIRMTDYLAGAGGNVFEPVLRRRYPVIAEALDWLGRHAPARLTGTGAALFAALATEREARAVLAQAPWSGFVARGLNRSPLLQRIQPIGA